MHTESHNVCVVRCMHEGLQWVFKGYKPSAPHHQGYEEEKEKKTEKK